MKRLAAIFYHLTLMLALRESTSAQTATTSPWNVERLYETPQFRWLDSPQIQTARTLMYAGEDYGAKPTEVFAFYASPNTLLNATTDKGQAPDRKPSDKVADTLAKFPGVVLLHGGGGTAFREWAELWAKRGYAAIAMDLAGYQPIAGQNAHAPNHRQRIDHPGPDQTEDEKFGSIDKPVNEQWPYHAVANAIRAHSLLRSFPEVDANRTAVTGISWGGYLTCITAGVDQRFQAAVPVYGCGFLHENSAWLNLFEKMQATERERWIKLWDPSQYLPKVSQPILFVNGTNDFAYPLDSYMKSFDLVPGDKQLCVTVNMPHSHPAGWAPTEIALFIDQHVRDGQPLLRVSDPQVEDGQVTIDVSGMSGENALVSAELHYTTGSEAINQRQWQTRAASLGSPGETVKVTAAVPPKEATAWFLTVKDSRQATVSTRVKY